jgi:hypothetical protein
MNQELELCELYRLGGIPLDRLPYTVAFEQMFANLVAKTGVRDQKTGELLTQQKVWVKLQAIRKAGKLPRIGRKGRACLAK